jgi:hypothetical protein
MVFIDFLLILLNFTLVPWVVVNGAHDTDAENAVEEDMVAYVC